MDWFLIISASLCGIASVVALFMSLRWCAVPAFVSMLLASLLWTLDIPMLLGSRHSHDMGHWSHAATGCSI